MLMKALLEQVLCGVLAMMPAMPHVIGQSNHGLNYSWNNSFTSYQKRTNQNSSV